MTAVTGWYENSDRYLPLRHQPACLIDLVLARDIDSHRLLRGTGLFYEQLDDGRLISPDQLRCLLKNAREQVPADDTSFQFGHRLLPGHYGAVSTALAHACHLADAIDLLIRHRARLSPLLAPRLQLDDQHVCLYWLDTCGLGELRAFVVEVWFTAVSAYCHWQSGERLPWRFLFSHQRPGHVEQYQAHLGDVLHFGCQIDAMVLPRQYFQQPWPRASQTVAAMARREAEQERIQLGFEMSFVERVYQELVTGLQPFCSGNDSLDAVAERLQISPATCKRKLKAHDSSYQNLHDAVRKHVALYLYWARGYSSDAVAEYLGFHDTTNYRRSFKRWTGQLPSVLRQWLPQV